MFFSSFLTRFASRCIVNMSLACLKEIIGKEPSTRHDSGQYSFDYPMILMNISLERFLLPFKTFPFFHHLTVRMQRRRIEKVNLLFNLSQLCSANCGLISQ